MDLYQYESYEQYKNEQIKTNKRKIARVWVRDSHIRNILQTVTKNNVQLSEVKTILCHGTRNGAELSLFKKYCHNSNPIGTEISSTAKQFLSTYEWDFQEPKEEWINNFDIVYSNSFDHSMDPEKTFNTWTDQVKVNGFIAIQHRWSSEKVKPSDPLSMERDEIVIELEKRNFDIVCNNARDNRGNRVETRYETQSGHYTVIGRKK